MRFDRIHIPAFGPFTSLELGFPAQGGDLHVIYGANEAGKSSLLRAFRDLLFGIHGQTSDNFVHDYKKMRVLGEIVSRAGERLTFQRRKGNKHTLLDADGTPLPDNALAPFLGSVDQPYFSTMFGLGARELREGAEQLLRGEGDMGSALFSASMGGTPVQRVLATLAQEADSLFKSRAIHVSIRQMVKQYKNLQGRIREAAVKPEEWERIEGQVQEAEKERTSLEREIQSVTRDLEWICRCEDALPTVSRLGEEMGKLASLPLLPDVSSDFVERARAARKAAGDRHAEVHQISTHLTRLEEQLTGCRLSPLVLAESSALDRLHQERSVYREHKRAWADLETELAVLEATLRAGMQNLGLAGDFSTLETLRITSPVRLACEEAARHLQDALDAREANSQKLGDLKARIKALETQRHALPETDLTQLRDALSLAAEATEANRTLPANESEVKRLAQEVKDRHRELIGAPEDLDITAGLPVPSKATIRAIGEAMDELKREIMTEAHKIAEGKRQIDSARAELDRLQRRGALPSEQALRKAREHRDHGWSLVLEEWKGSGSKEELVPGMPLEKAFPQSVIEADRLADRLREQAEAVAQAEEKRLQISQSETQGEAAEKRAAELRSRLEECQAGWEAVWRPCSVSPLSPAEMEEWRESWSKFKERLRQLRVAEEGLRQKSEQVQEARRQLALVLSESSEKEFVLLFEKARARAQQAEQSLGQRIEVDRQIESLASHLESLEQLCAGLADKVDAALRAWKAQCRTIGMTEGVSTQTGLALLQERQELLAQFDRWKHVSTKWQRAKDAVHRYEQVAREKAIALGAGGDTAEAQEAQLWAMLTRALEAQTRHGHLAEQIKETKEALEKSKTACDRAVEELHEILRMARLETIEALEPLLADIEQRDRALAHIASLRDTLSGLARGQTVDAFLAHIRAEDMDALPQRKHTLKALKQEKEAALQAVRDTLFGLNSRRQALEACGDAAADYRQQAESCAARLKQDASRFIRLRLAVHFLQAQIEQFRQENQGPLLEKSGQIFKAITRGAFSGLKPEFNADDLPVLVGLRPDQSTVRVEGMSDGSRDQLYLALRLAALDRYLDQYEPMPLILDDLLITFDDDRTAAILPQLAALAQRTQVFLFTHHDHLVELCRKALPEDTFHLYRLPSNGSEKGP